MIDKITLENILNFYKCPCLVADTRTGGGYIDFVLSPQNGTTINKLQSRVNDLSIALGKAVTIAIENLKIILRVKDAEQATFDYFKYCGNKKDVAGQLAIGINPRGQFVQYNLFDMPHLLVAGATGSGKSVFLHDAIISLACGNHVSFTLIDLKRVELSVYNGLSCVDGDVITDAEQAQKRLLFEVAEMENRYKIMERYGVRNYKDLPSDKALKARVIVIDELADLMLNKSTRRSVENSIVRIAQLGRASGIHLILATQRPSTDVITGLIKANMPCRIAFMVSSAVDARVIGCKGAESLNGKGDALLSIAGHKELERVQAFYIDNKTLIDFVSQVKERQRPQRKKGFFERLFR